jgi:hypothetical protein
MSPFIKTVIAAALGKGKPVSHVQLMDILTDMSGKGAKFVGLTTVTEPKLLKSCPYNGVKKVSEVTVQVNYDYVNAVENQLIRENKDLDDYKQGTSWYNVVTFQNGKLTPFAKHKENGDLYLRCRHMSTTSSKYFDDNGNEIAEESLKAYLPKKSKPTNQGTDTAIRATTYKLGNIVAVRVDGNNYVTA